MKIVRHFKSLLDINKKEFLRIIERAITLKNDSKNHVAHNIFDKMGIE